MNIIDKVKQGYVTASEAARLKNVSRQAIHKVIKRKRLRTYEFYGLLLVKKSDLGI